MPVVYLKPFFHRNAGQIGIYFEKNKALTHAVKKISGVKWSQSHICWYIPENKEAFLQLSTAVKAIALVDCTELKNYFEKKKEVAISIRGHGEKPVASSITQSTAWKLSAGNLAALNTFLEQLKLKAYSISTIRTYRNEFMQLLQILKNTPVNELTTDDLRRYFVYCFEKLKLSENTLHSRINAIKFYFEQVLKTENFFWEIPRPKKPLQLPRHFNQVEVAAIIKSAGNLKHRAMLMLAYGAGLRVSEVVNLKSKNVDSRRMCILIEQAKGKKDRVVSLSPVLLILLREYWKEYKPSKTGFLFQGQSKGEPYSVRSLQLVLAAAKEKAGILKSGSIHALRHSFATHLLDKGTDVTMIMKLLGHNDIKTTLRYLHVTNRDMLQVISPLDDLDL